MTPSRPYLIRALYEWINDNQLSPYILVNANIPEVHVPREFVDSGKIVFNISPDAIDNLLIGNIELQFDASFSGISRYISIPISAVLAIYAQENGAGMSFGDEPGDSSIETKPSSDKQKETPKRPHLKIVKDIKDS